MARLVLQPLEYNVCVTCANKSTVKDPTFLGNRCRVCNSLHGAKDPTKVLNRLLLMDTETPIYDREKRWACTSSGFLHKKPGTCPAAFASGTLQRCGPCQARAPNGRGSGRLSALPTYVWVAVLDAEPIVAQMMQLQDVGDGDGDGDGSGDDDNGDA